MSGDIKSSILDLDRLDAPSRVHSVLTGALKKSLGDGCMLTSQAQPLWTPEFFGLDQTRAYRQATEEQKQTIIEKCSLALLEESLFIEQNGMWFATKMSMLSETLEERMLYNLFAGDEATHYHQVRLFVPVEGELSAPNGFHHLLEQIIREGDRDSLVFIIQVVLEGWGMNHYKSLSRGCEDPVFKGVLAGILKDEARHHGSGLVLYRDRGMSKKSQSYVAEVMAKFLDMIRMGPQSVAAVVEETCGMTRAQKIELFRELDTETHSRERLERLRSLMTEDGEIGWLEKLDARGSFQPFGPEACV
ncbi:MAG: ferritin-like domain-containing protein [Myxococcota bacterium]|nr:ferritin-like domain-containing protein [Myxococcota bacterium]